MEINLMDLERKNWYKCSFRTKTQTCKSFWEKKKKKQTVAMISSPWKTECKEKERGKKATSWNIYS